MKWLLAWGGMWVVFSLLVQIEGARGIVIAFAWLVAATATYILVPKAAKELQTIIS